LGLRQFEGSLQGGDGAGFRQGFRGELTHRHACASDLDAAVQPVDLSGKFALLAEQSRPGPFGHFQPEPGDWNRR